MFGSSVYNIDDPRGFLMRTDAHVLSPVKACTLHPTQPHSTPPPPESVLHCETAPPYLSLRISVQQTLLWLPPVVELSQCEDRLTLHTISVSATEQVKIKVFWA